MRTQMLEEEEKHESFDERSDSDEELSASPAAKCFTACCTEGHLVFEILTALLRHPCLLCSAILVLLAFTIYILTCEDFHIITGFYLLTQIVTTIGWGDITVENQYTQLVMSFFVLFNLIVVAKVLSLAMDIVIKRQDSSARRALCYFESGFQFSEEHDWMSDYVAAKRWEKYNRFLIGLFTFAFFIGAGTLFYSLVEYCTCSYGKTQVEGCSRGPDRNDMQLCKETGGYIMTWINAFYFSVISLTTVGFGDYSPKSFEGRLFAIPWAIFGVLSTAVFIGATSDLFSSDNDEEAIMGVTDIDEATFKKMDADKSGYLTKAEFRSYVLVQRGIVDEDLLAAIDAKYDYMDMMSPGDQKVTWKDVVAMQQLEVQRRQDMKANRQDGLHRSWLRGWTGADELSS